MYTAECVGLTELHNYFNVDHTFEFSVQELAHPVHSNVVSEAPAQTDCPVVDDVMDDTCLVPARDSCSHDKLWTHHCKLSRPIYYKLNT